MQPEMIRNPDDPGGETVPSVVSLDPLGGGVTVGTHAKRNLANDPANTIIEIKREMRGVFTPDTLARYGAGAQADDIAIGMPLKVPLGGSWDRPQEISDLILMKMTSIAEAEIAEESRDVATPVP